MKHRLSLFLFTFLLAAGMMLASCSKIITKYGYGRMAPVMHDSYKQEFNVVLPDNAPSISQRFSPPYHEGFDIIGKSGTPVIAAASGLVIRSHHHVMYGNRIIIDHGKDENGRHILTMYYHLSKRTTKEGESVVRGQKIGELGMTGFLAGFPHLHFGVYQVDNKRLLAINPHLHWADGKGLVTCFDPERRLDDQPFRTTYPLPCR